MTAGRARDLARCILFAATALLADRPAEAAPAWFRVDTNAWFDDWRAQLQDLVDQQPGRPPSRLCIVGWRDGRDPMDVQAYVLWKAQHRLVTWTPVTGDRHALVHETKVLDLWTDVVANERMIGGSTYLVTRRWLADVQRHCRIDGTTVILSPAT